MSKMKAAASGSMMMLLLDVQSARVMYPRKRVFSPTHNSAQGVQFPTLAFPSTTPYTAFVCPLPIAPPIRLRPLTCPTKSGCVWNSLAAFVKLPVATTHAVPGAHERSAAAAASTAETSVRAATRGSGSNDVPSRPDSPWMSSAFSERCGRSSGEEAPW